MAITARALFVAILLTLSVSASTGSYLKPKYVPFAGESRTGYGLPITPNNPKGKAPSVPDVTGMEMCVSANVAANFILASADNTLPLTISNAAWSKGACPQWGIVDTWSAGDALGIEISEARALVLSTGNAGEVQYTVNDLSSFTGAYNGSGDPDLSTLVNAPTFDAAVLEMDVTPDKNGQLAFKYILASEEYDEFVGLSYNDVFALWIIGPDGVKTNVAILPFSNNIPVAINNVNAKSFSQYYRDNLVIDSKVSPPISLYATQYDGFTTLLNTLAYNVTAGESYHLKLAIADVSDDLFDSIIIIQGASLGVNTAPVAVASLSSSSLGCGESVTLDGSGSTVSTSGASISVYLWSFTSSNSSIVPFYRSGEIVTLVQPGNSIPASLYTVTLTVTDSNGLTGSTATTLNITACPPPTNKPPVAAFVGAPYTMSVCQGLGQVTLDASASTDPDGSVVGYLWTISNTAGLNLQHSGVNFPLDLSQGFAVGNTYTVTLFVRDNEDKSDGAATTLSVVQSTSSGCSDPPPHDPPVANPGGPYSLVNSVNSSDCSRTITLDGSSSTAAVGYSLTYQWTIFDSSTFSVSLPATQSPTAQISMASLGLSPKTSYTIRLTVRDSISPPFLTNSKETSLTVPDTCGVVGDPHFLGAHGTRFDFNGKLDHAYCLITDKTIHVNAKFGGYSTAATVGSTVNSKGKGVRSWIKELAFFWKESGSAESQKLLLVAADGKVHPRQIGLVSAIVYNGQKLAVPSSPGVVLEMGELSLKFVGAKELKQHNVERFRLVIKDKVDALLEVQAASSNFQRKNSSELHFDLHFYKFKATKHVHGVLGQTFRSSEAQLLKAAKYQALQKLLGEPVKADGASGFGFLDGTPEDYAATNIMKPDCQKAVFA